MVFGRAPLCPRLPDFRRVAPPEQPSAPLDHRQVQGLNRTLKEATVQRYHGQATDEFNEHLQTFLLAYNHAKRLKTLRGLTPHEFICQQWYLNPTIFIRAPTQFTLGIYA